MYIVPPLWPHTEDVTISSRFYDPSSGDLYQAGHLLSFSVWSESWLSPWRNRRSLPTHRETARNFSAKSRGVSPRAFAEKTLGKISDCYFSPGVFRGETRKRSFFLGLICLRNAAFDVCASSSFSSDIFGRIWNSFVSASDHCHFVN